MLYAKMDVNNELDFLDSLHSDRIDLQEVLAKNDLLRPDLPANYLNEFNLDQEEQKMLTANRDKEEICKSIAEYTELLRDAEQTLAQLQTKKQFLKVQRKEMEDKISNMVKKVEHLKKLRKPGSGDRKKISNLRNMVQMYANIFKMVIQGSEEPQDKSKTIISGFVYNKQGSYLENFQLQTGLQHGWDLIEPAAHCDWLFEDSDTEDKNSK